MAATGLNPSAVMSGDAIESILSAQRAVNDTAETLAPVIASQNKQVWESARSMAETQQAVAEMVEAAMPALLAQQRAANQAAETIGPIIASQQKPIWESARSMAETQQAVKETVEALGPVLAAQDNVTSDLSEFESQTQPRPSESPSQVGGEFPAAVMEFPPRQPTRKVSAGISHVYTQAYWFLENAGLTEFTTGDRLLLALAFTPTLMDYGPRSPPEYIQWLMVSLTLVEILLREIRRE